MKNIPIEVSARHLHLSRKDLDILFGKDYSLTIKKQLTQPCDFSAEESVDIDFNGKKLNRVRVVGPEREETQVEISQTDAFSLGIYPPLRLSGDLNNSIGCSLFGPKGVVNLSRGVIIAKRHLHCSLKEAEDFGLKNGDLISIKVKGERGVVFDNIVVRANKGYMLCLHLDTDEGNAVLINKTGEGEIV